MNEVIIGGVIGLAGVVLGYILQRLSDRSTERKLIEAEFIEIVNTIYYKNVVNNLYYELSFLRKFFLRNPDCLKHNKNNEFFQKWLTDLFVEEGMAGGGNAWTAQKVTDLRLDLEKLKI